jgi:hypothetical protein
MLSCFLDNLKPCNNYGIGVKAWADEIVGVSQEKEFSSSDDKPGSATNLDITETFQDGFIATWCPPEDNPQCAKNWDWDTRETDTNKKAALGGDQATTYSS